MSGVHNGRYTADLGDGGEAVLFLIGMRINHFWQIWKWLPVAVSMPAMLAELRKDRSLGLLGRPRTFVSGRTVMVQQYWNSFDDLESYARAADRVHMAAWRRFNRKVRDNGSVGIFHETYRVTEGAVETLYINMPVSGLAEGTAHVTVGAARQTAAMRMGLRAADEAPVATY